MAIDARQSNPAVANRQYGDARHQLAATGTQLGLDHHEILDGVTGAEFDMVQMHPHDGIFATELAAPVDHRRCPNI